jgi:alpha-galactosidase
MKQLLWISLLAFIGGCINQTAANKESKAITGNFEDWAPTPPMGWNSYNCYGAAVTEKEVKANADYMAKKLKKFGWQYIVVDYCWSYPHPPGSIQSNPPQFRLKNDQAPVPWLAMDEFGRLLPDLRKFPSSGGNSFKPLADYIHQQGLKFGIHVMRGIPRQAVWAKSPVKGTDGITADMIADTTSVCPWLNQMYGVNMSKPGAQEYYNSLVELYKEWNVDFIKMDDIDLNEKYPYYKEEAEAMHKAILKSQSEIVLSLSLNMKLENKEHVKSVSNMWRISKDFWDDWEQLKLQFEHTKDWSAEVEPGHWPDADMLQLGWISRRGPKENERESRFTKDEQYTHMTLWCIARSPLMMGGDMPDNSDFVESLLTNNEVIAVNQHAIESRQLFRTQGLVVWTSKSSDKKYTYLAMFNLNEENSEISVELADLGITKKTEVRDLWTKSTIGTISGKFTSSVNPHGAKLFRLEEK